jgi:hypothetical protein
MVARNAGVAVGRKANPDICAPPGFLKKDEERRKI